MQQEDGIGIEAGIRRLYTNSSRKVSSDASPLVNRKDRFVDALQYAKDIIAFDTTSSLSNAALTDYVEDRLRQMGCQTERLEYEDENGVRKASVVGKRGEGRGGMAYFGHTDVVPAVNWFTREHGPFAPAVQDGRLYGQGGLRHERVGGQHVGCR